MAVVRLHQADVVSPSAHSLARDRDLGDVLQQFAATPGIETLVLFGSFARGEARESSDVDLVVDGPLADDFRARRRAAGQLSERLGVPVELNALGLLRHSPSVLLGAIDDGRVIADPGGRWAEVCNDRSQVEVEALAEHAEHRVQRAAAIDQIARYQR